MILDCSLLTVHYSLKSEGLVAGLIYYVNGEYVAAEKAALPINDLGIVRGYGVFDALRTYNRKPFHLRAHVERLFTSAASIRLELTWSVAEVEQLVHDLLAHNYERSPELGDVQIRIKTTGGPSENYFTPEGNPSLAIVLLPIKPRDTDLYARGGRLVTMEMDRFMPTVKSLNYIDAVMVSQEAAAAGAVETVYRTSDGLVTEATRSSLFLVKGSHVLTAKDAVLDGITRRVVCELAREHFALEVTDLRYDEIASMDEALLVGTGKEVLPIVQIDEMMVGDGVPGPVTTQLMTLFEEYVTNFQPTA